MDDRIKLKQDYCVELLKVIDNGFKSYGLYFRWKSSLIDTEIPAYIPGVRSDFEFCAMAINDEIISEMANGDEEAFKNFIRDIVNNFLGSHSDKLKLEIKDGLGDVSVQLDPYKDNDGKKGVAMFVEFWLKEIDK